MLFHHPCVSCDSAARHINFRRYESWNAESSQQKLRDAVPVCFIESGKEVKRYKNIEIPDEIKRLPFSDFKFDVPANGAITFKIMFEPGVLPTEWPEARQRRDRQRNEIRAGRVKISKSHRGIH